MTVLTIIGILIGLYLIYILTQKLNSFTQCRYNYELFESGSAIIVSIGYYCLFFGYGLYQEALSNNGDILNGIILMGLGTILVGLIILRNIQHVDIPSGLLLSLIQLVIYIGVAFGALIIMFITVAAVMGRYNNCYGSDCY